MKNKTLMGVFAFGVVALLAIGFVAAFPMGHGGQDLSEEEQAEMQAHREAVVAALEADDYEEWKALKESMLTEERFALAQERHAQMEEIRAAVEEAKETGDWSTVEELREEYGVSKRGHRMGPGKGMGEGHHGRMNGECRCNAE